jgi:hypothetical protein
MSLLTQFKLVSRANEIEIAANRSIQQFSNSFDSVLADFQRFAVDATAAGFDADTLSEIETRKAEIISTANAAIQARLAVLASL